MTRISFRQGYSENTRLARFRGCLIGGAIGDSLGMPVESYSRQMIRERFGEIRDLLPKQKKNFSQLAGSWTDDTYMTMLTAKSIIECGAVDIKHMTRAYFDALNYNFGVAGTTRQALELRMAGQVITSLAKGRHGGAGAASHIAPVGLLEYQNLEKLCLSAEQVSRITHLGQDAVDAAVLVAFTVGWIIKEERDIYSLLGKIMTLAEQRQSNIYYGLKMISDLLRSSKAAPNAIEVALEGMEEIGTDSLALRLVPSALYAFMQFPDDYQKSVLAAVNAGGDTDTRAAITGTLSGAYNSLEGIPRRWINKIQDKEVIFSYADELLLLTSEG